MKPNRWNRFLAAFQCVPLSSSLVISLIGLAAQPVHSATLTWDVTPGTTGVGDGAITGGVGNWDTTPSLGNWTSDGGANNVAWVNGVTPDIAVFGGTAGIVTQAGIVTNGLIFNTAGYSVAGGTLTLGGTTPKITTAADATVSSVLAGTAGMTKDGAAILNIPSKATYTGNTIVNAGVLNLTGGGGASGTIRGTATINNGATLRISTGDATGYGTGTDRLAVINVNQGGLLNIAVTNNQTLGNGVINLTGGAITGVSGSNLDFFQTTSGLNSLASSVTSTVNGTRLSIRQTAGLTVNVADGTTLSGVDLDVGSVIASNGGFLTAPLIKTGTGTMLLRAANTYSGATQINGGSFILGAAGTATATDITVSNVGSTLGVATTGKTLKSLTLNTGTRLAIAASKTATTTVTNALTTNGTITLEPNFLDVPAASDVYNLVTAGSAAGAATFPVDTLSFGASRVTGTAAVVGNTLQLTVGTGAASLVWDNDAATSVWNLNTTANFDNGGSPDVFKTFDGVTFDGTAPGTITLAGEIRPSAVNVTSSTGDHTFAGSGSLVGGVLTKSGTSALTITNSNSHASTLVTGGTLNANGASSLGNVAVVNGGLLNLGNANALGAATLTLTSGSFDNTTGALLTLANPQVWNGTTTFVGTGELITTGGVTLTANSELSVAANTVTANGIISGAFNLAKSGAGVLRLNTGHTYSGTTDVTGSGRLWVSNTLRNSSSFNVGTGATLEFGATNIFVAGHGTAMPATRVITVDGGTLLMNNLMDARFGSVTLNNGATWTSDRVLTNYDALLANTTGGAANVTVGGTGASVMNGSGGIHLQDVQNFVVADTTSSSAADLVVSMVLAGPGTTGGANGGINKTGAGTMVLNGVNTYTGATLINGGILELGTAGSITPSAVTVNATGTLKAAVSEKTVAALTANDGSTLNLPANKLQSTRVTGALTTAGNVTLRPVFTDTPAPGDNYDFVSAATFTDGATYTVDTGALGASRVTATAAAELGQYLVLTIGTGSANLTWTNAAATGTWNLNSDANFDNGGSPDVFKTFDAVTFGDTAAGTVNLDGTLYPSTVTVNSTSDYTFGGSGTLGGGALVKLGSSTLNLVSAQSPASVTVGGGTLNVADAAALGSGRITLNGGTLNNGTGGALSLANLQSWNTAATFTGSELTVGGAVTLTAATDLTTGPSALTVSGAINGAAGALIKKGSGTVNLNGAAASTLTSGLDVAEGSVLVNTATGATLVNVGSGATAAAMVLDGNQVGNRLAALAAVTVGGNGTVTVNGVNALPNHTNSVNFTVEAGGLLNFTSGGSTAITAAGSSHHHMGNLILNGGTMSLPYSGAGTAYNGESVQLNGTVSTGGTTPSTIQFGAGALPVNAGLALQGARTFTVADVTGSPAADLTINAELENSDTPPGSLVKDGPGTLALTGSFAHSYTGTTTVTAGTLSANGSVAGPLLVDAAGTIAPGVATGSFGAGNTTVAGTYACEIDGVTGDTLAVTGNLDLTGSTLAIAVLGGGATEATYVIATYTGALTGTFGTVTGLPSGYSVNYDTPGQIVLTNAADAYDSWESGYGIAGAGADTDSDNDGIPNGIEFVIGGIPSGPGSNSNHLLPTITIDGNYLNFTFRRTDASASYDPLVEYGSTLTGWLDAEAGEPVLTPVIINEANDGFGAGVDSVEVRIPRSLAVDDKLFARLKVTIPAP
jgi:fibronectin-binding autotransporter adhesin